VNGEQLKASRLRLNLTQAQLAAKLDVNRMTIANWERADAVPRTAAIVVRMLDALNEPAAGRSNGSV
jgi:transcriptional regulator with XRE-family HTH domain